MKTEKITLVTSIAAASDLQRFRLVAYTGARAGAGARTLGIANAGYASGEQAGVNVSGELLVEAGAAIAVGAQVESDATGRAITLDSGIAGGVARDAAAAAGDIIRIVR